MEAKERARRAPKEKPATSTTREEEEEEEEEDGKREGGRADTKALRSATCFSIEQSVKSSSYKEVEEAGPWPRASYKTKCLSFDNAPVCATHDAVD